MNTKKFGLGRGISALIPEGVSQEENITQAAMEKIKPNPFQPRKNFPREALEELAASILEQGVLQPVILRPRAGGYDLIAGERRLRAAQMAGLNTIPAVVRPCTDHEALELTIVENLQREDLNPVEEASAYQKLSREFSFTQEQIAKRVGKSRAYVTNALRLLQLPDDIREALHQGKISAGHARALLSVTSETFLLQLFQRILSENLSVRQVEQAAKATGAKVSRKLKPQISDVHIRDLQDKLQKHLATRVQILHGQKRGTIQIQYFSAEDLERVVERILE